MRLRTQILTHNNCYTVGRTIKPKGVMVHSTGANNPKVSRYVPGNSELGYNTGGNHWDQSNAQWKAKYKTNLDKCVHAFVGRFADGNVGTVQTLPWNRRGWHCGKGKKGATANDTHISFEICEDGLDDPAYFAAVYQEAAELTAYLCELYGLDPLEDGVVICHQEGYRRGVASNHADVLHWFPKFGKSMDDFRRDVDKIMRGEDTVTQEQFDAMLENWLERKAAEPADEWAKPYIERAIDAGAMSDVGGTIASPKSFITRQEVAVVVSALAKRE